jgi:WD40 repeat protein
MSQISQVNHHHNIILHSNVGQTYDAGKLFWFNKSSNSKIDSSNGNMFSSHPQSIASNQKLICNTSTDNLIRLWEIKSPSSQQQKLTGNYPKCLSILRGHRTLIKCLIWLPNHAQIISGSMDAQIKVWSKNECIRTLHGHSSAIECLLYVDRTIEEVLISSSLDCLIKVWNVSEGVCLRTLESHLFWVKHLLYLPDVEHRLVSSSEDDTIKIWNLNTGVCLSTLNQHSDAISCIIAIKPSMSHPTTCLVSGSSDCCIKVWNAETCECVRTLMGHTNVISCLLFISKRNQLVSGSWDRRVKVWDLSDVGGGGGSVLTLKSHTKWIVSMVFIETTDELITGSGDFSIKIWDIKLGVCLKTLYDAVAIVEFVYFNEVTHELLIAWRDGTLKIWNYSSGAKWTHAKVLKCKDMFDKQNMEYGNYKIID